MLVNNAGIYIGKPFTEHTVEDVAAVTNVNLASFYHFTQFAIAEMEAQSGGQRGQRDDKGRRWCAHGVYSVLAALPKGGDSAPIVTEKSRALTAVRAPVTNNHRAPRTGALPYPHITCNTRL
ncbi:SDR family NAD(P)-dependent oxidoreductase [Paraburkholderia hospita]|uniref:SDR family NAD(P)-dependent oxidoreductase n=1 Tax=Paraburkholderia hospita TaxID=169430 RepID=UPI001F244329|nr:SDR family NAD(P)-dependent oxidoreductase [Paraburkholderia hospita]